jgi:hypothetical protein
MIIPKMTVADEFWPGISSTKTPATKTTTDVKTLIIITVFKESLSNID